MLGKKVENPRPLMLAEVKDMLTERFGQPDFGYEQQTALNYANAFTKLTLEDAKKLQKKLTGIEALKPESVAKIVDVLPEHTSTLLAILSKDKVTLSEAEQTEVLELVGEYREKMIAPPEPPPVAEEPAEGATEGEAGAEKAEGEATDAEPKKAAKETEKKE